MKFLLAVSVTLLMVNGTTTADPGRGMSRPVVGAESEFPVASAALTGYVTDAETGEKLISATVAIVGAGRGAYTNSSGYFSVKNIPEGEWVVRVSRLGYLPQEDTVEFQLGESLRRDYELAPEPVSGDVVVVTADREEEKRQITVSKVEIPVEQLSQLRIGGEADVFRALQFLPGVLTSSQISSGLYIRGGSPDQNLVLIDGSTVYNPSHLLGFFSTFNPDAIKDVDLIKGAYPAEYGGRLSAVLDLRQKDGNNREFQGIGSLGLVSSRLSLQGPIGNGSYFVGGRRTYLDLITKLLPDDPENPFPDFHFYDINGKVTQTFGKRDIVSLSGFASADRLSLSGAGLDFSLGLSNQVGALRWTHNFGSDLFLAANLSGSYYETGFSGENGGFVFSAENSIRDISQKVNTEWYATDRLTVKTGVEATQYRFSYFQNFSGDSTSIIDEGQNEAGQVNFSVDDLTLGAYGQVNLQVGDLIALQGGLRGDHFRFSNVTTVDPRAAVRVQITEDFGLKAAWGIYHQYLRLATQPDFTFFDTWMPTDSSVEPGRAAHYVLAAESRLLDWLDLNVDLYYKDLDHISEFNSRTTEAQTVADVFYDGEGEAYGAEIFLQKKSGRLVGWLGYGLGWIEARFDSVNGGRPFRPKYDRRHDFKVVSQYQLNDRWQVGASFTFQSGQSYTGATSRFRSQLPRRQSDYDLVIPSERYGLRLPPSHQLNLNVNYSTTLFSLPTRLLLDVYNVYSRRDIWFRFYDTDGQVTEVTDVRLLPIIPTVAIEVTF